MKAYDLLGRIFANSRVSHVRVSAPFVRQDFHETAFSQ
ncbi:hypothetical protein SAMN05216227_105413 [Pseudorhodobacter antarcticus]|uniref:Uncharacterized protein n=1 Tax=Pseudorhodobacter antarcticus TaxID=1077947 RepID=A0A1H8MF06_9RHOB|nr:hypothetical protein SAMN05216227_105413 [Pseudorhodobacter antarcticus]